MTHVWIKGVLSFSCNVFKWTWVLRFIKYAKQRCSVLLAVICWLVISLCSFEQIMQITWHFFWASSVLNGFRWLTINVFGQKNADIDDSKKITFILFIFNLIVPKEEQNSVQRFCSYLIIRNLPTTSCPWVFLSKKILSMDCSCLRHRPGRKRLTHPLEGLAVTTLESPHRV